MHSVSARAEALHDIRDGLQAHRVWRAFGWNEIRNRYRRSVLGPFWLTLALATTISALAIVPLFPLANAGVIAGYTARLSEDYEKGQVKAHVLITALPKLAARVEAELRRIPEVRTLHSVSGASHFVASKALVLPELARAVTGRELPEAGALVVVPGGSPPVGAEVDPDLVVDPAVTIDVVEAGDVHRVRPARRLRGGAAQADGQAVGPPLAFETAAGQVGPRRW